MLQVGYLESQYSTVFHFLSVFESYLVVVLFLPLLELIVDLEIEVFLHSVMELTSSISFDQNSFPSSLSRAVLWAFREKNNLLLISSILLSECHHCLLVFTWLRFDHLKRDILLSA